jgi:hypothetical protein
MLIFVDCEHRLIPERGSIVVSVADRNGRRLEEALIPLDASLEIRNRQGVVVESWK